MTLKLYLKMRITGAGAVLSSRVVRAYLNFVFASENKTERVLAKCFELHSSAKGRGKHDSGSFMGDLQRKV